MIIDKLNEFADNLVVPTAVGNNNVGDVIDLGGPGRDIGQSSENLFLVIIITATFTSGTSSNIAFELVSDDNDALSSPTVHGQTPTFDESALVAGSKIVVPAPAGGDLSAYERYLGVRAVISGAAITAGRIDAFLTHDAGHWKSYPDAVN